MTCGVGIRKRTRTCTTASCKGNTEETGECTISFRARRFDWEMNVFMKREKFSKSCF